MLMSGKKDKKRNIFALHSDFCVRNGKNAVRLGNINVLALACKTQTRANIYQINYVHSA
jgi:hypothetical protein